MGMAPQSREGKAQLLLWYFQYVSVYVRCQADVTGAGM
jgi:hypothetical protein